MSKQDWEVHLQIISESPSFRALMFAALRTAGNAEVMEKIYSAFPDIYQEYIRRYRNGGPLTKEEAHDRHTDQPDERSLSPD